MPGAEQLKHDWAILRKAEEYLASAEDNLVAERCTAAAGHAIHTGISARNAIGPALLAVMRRASSDAPVVFVEPAVGVGHDGPRAR